MCDSNTSASDRQTLLEMERDSPDLYGAMVKMFAAQYRQSLVPDDSATDKITAALATHNPKKNCCAMSWRDGTSLMDAKLLLTLAENLHGNPRRIRTIQLVAWMKEHECCKRCYKTVDAACSSLYPLSMSPMEIASCSILALNSIIALTNRVTVLEHTVSRM